MSTPVSPPPPIIPAPDKLIIENQTAKRLKIERGTDEVFVLGPFERRTVETDEFERFEVRRLIALGLAALVPSLETRSNDALIGVGFWAVIAYIVGGFIVRAQLPGAEAGATPIAQLWLMQHYWPIAGVVLAIVVTALLALYYNRGSDVMRIVTQWIAFLVTATLTFGVPTFIVYRFGGGRELVLTGSASVIVGRGLQILLIAIGSLLPALMYYLFDRQKLGTLRVRLEQQLLRLDPAAQNLSDIRAKYGLQIAEVYGSGTTSDGRLVRATRWPILIATILTMVGWMLTLPFFRDLGANDVLAYFSPPRSPVVFAFLGAYVFTLYSILRRYVRGDLKPKAYSSISVRIFVVVILAWMIDIVFPITAQVGAIASVEQATALALAFSIGIIPETGLTWIQELVRKRIGPLAFRIEEKHPLTDLEGIDIYDRGRLLDEGVSNIESLAHCDLIELILDTRIPVPRIVDWLDQAILYLHLATPYASLDSAGEKEQKIASLRRTLRNYGIRTATDLLAAFQQAKDRNKTEEFLKQLRGEFPETSIEPVQVIIDVMNDDEWFDHVRHWRQNRITEEFVIQLPQPRLAAAP